MSGRSERWGFGRRLFHKSKEAGRGGPLRRHFRRLAAEPLEDRRMLSVAPLYVDIDSPVMVPDGNSWATAYVSLQDALDRAATLNADGNAENDIEQIWIAEGTYIPTELSDADGDGTIDDDPRSATFSLVDGVSLHGGFVGTEATVGERQPPIDGIFPHETILTGDLDQNDDLDDFYPRRENAYTVVTAVDLTQPTTIDGLTITGGSASSNTGWSLTANRSGGGIYNRSSTLVVIDSTLSLNYAITGGGAIQNSGTLTISGSIITGNESGGGGGISTTPYHSLTIVDSTFTGNAGKYVIRNFGTAAITGSTISDNTGPIHNSGSMTISGSIISDSGLYGIHNVGVLNVINSHISDNGSDGVWSESGQVYVSGSTISGNSGLGISSIRGPMTIVSSTISNNIGGGIVASEDTLIVTDSSITGNSDDSGPGGGIRSYFNTLIVDNSIISGNQTEQSGGGIYYRGANMFTITNSTVSDNTAGDRGGGIYVAGDPFSEIGGDTFTITNSTVSNNTAGEAGGGIRVNRAAGTISHSTISANSAIGGWPGGGIANRGGLLTVNASIIVFNNRIGIYNEDGSLTVTNSTFWGNSGYDVHNSNLPAEAMTLTNSIVGRVYGSLTPESGFNLIGVDSRFMAIPGPGDDRQGGTADDVVGDYRLRPDSPAIDAGSDSRLIDAIGIPLGTDFDGNPRISGAHVDIGAFEWQNRLGEAIRLNPVGGLMSVARENVGQIDLAGGEDRIVIFAEAGQTLAAIVTPDDPSVVLSVSIEEIGAIFTAVGPGMPVVLPPQRIESAGLITLVVQGDGPSTFSFDLYRNAALELQLGDSTDDNRMPIDESRIDLPSERFGLIGNSTGPALPDVDVYTLDLTGMANQRIDVVLDGQADVDYSGQTLELLDADGTVLATAVADPLGVTATNYDLAILDFLVPGDGVYALRLVSDVEGQYGLVVTDSLLFTSEPSNEPNQPLRNLTDVGRALGYADLDIEELLVNGGFETGDFTGWTAKSNGEPELTPWTVGQAGGGFFFDSAPIEGSYSAYNGFDGEAGLSYELYQDVAIPADDTIVTLTTNHRIVYTGTRTEPSGQVRTLTISVRDTDDNVLETLYEKRIQPELRPETDLGWSTRSFDLTAYAGQTVRIHFQEEIPQSYAGPAMIEFDDIRLISGAPRGDWYEISVSANELVTIVTQTPLDHARQMPPNELDPALHVYDPAGELIAVDTDSAADGKNARIEFVAPATGTYRIRVSTESGQGEYVLRADTSARVVGRKIFYNNSAWDTPAGKDIGPTDDNPTNDNAVATDKQALLPGQTATKLNYTSYDKGINGIMVDIAGLAEPGNLNAVEDFAFKVGDGGDPDGWAIAPAPLSVAVREGAGVDGSDRVTITWSDNAIEKQWLQVTVKATDNTGLLEEDIFYFGNAPGEAGDDPIHAIVNATDEIAARNFQHSAVDRALIDDPYDYNRDGLVDATDQIIARGNQTNPLTMLRLIVAPAVDLVLKQAVMEDRDASETLSAALDWQYEYESVRSKDATSKRSTDVEATVDRLLATDWAS